MANQKYVMNKALFKIILIFIVINCFVYPMQHGIFIRMLLFCFAGVFTGFCNFKKGMELDKDFLLKSILFLFVLTIYYIHRIEVDIMILITNMRSIFCEIDYDNMYPLVINFFIESFITSSALFSYIISYFSYEFTLYVLDRRNNS